MIRLFTFLAGCLWVAGALGAQIPEPTVQVLLQGNDPQQLEAALERVGGEMTHQLPIIDGIGGVVAASTLEELERQPGVRRVVEDFNPPKSEETRDCAVVAGLDLAPTPGGAVWRVFNLGNEPVTARIKTLTSPHGGGDVRLNGLVAGAALELPAGETQLLLSRQIHGENRSQAATHALNQNGLEVVLDLPNCSLQLPRAYEDNHNDYYYPGLVGADLLNDAGITGRGVGVAIIDSGLWDVPALTTDSLGKSRVLAHYDARLNSTVDALQDAGGHGSHMASIIANSSPNERPGGKGFKGVAPDADLIIVTAFAPEGDGDFLDIIRGIQWVVEQKERLNIRVLNMSLSATPRFEFWDDPMNQAVLKAWEAGILVVAAAGNDGPDWGTIGSPGNNPFVLTVGAITDSWTPEDRSDDYIPDFSSRGPTAIGHLKPDVVAPGGHMTGLVPPDARLAQESPNYVLHTGEFVSTGSSQSAALVSGIAALLFQADPSLSNDEAKCLIKTSAEPAINRDGRLSYSPFIQGDGLVSAARALTLGDTRCEQQSLNLQGVLAGTEQPIGPAIALPDGSPSLPGLESAQSATAPKKGPSNDRRWGVKAHIERLDATGLRSQRRNPRVIDWFDLYERERQRLEALSRPMQEQN